MHGLNQQTRVLERVGEGIMAVATLLQDAAGLDRKRCKATGIWCWIAQRRVTAMFAFLGVLESVLVLDLDQLSDFVVPNCHQIS